MHPRKFHEDGRRLNAEHCRSFYFASSPGPVVSSSGLEHLMRPGSQQYAWKRFGEYTWGSAGPKPPKLQNVGFRMAVSRNS